MNKPPTELITDADFVEPANAMSVGAHAESARAQAEIQAALLYARGNPRDMQAAIDTITVSCQREGLAAKSSYLYSRGGTEIIGPNIRLMEVIAASWGNLQYGYRILSESATKTQGEAFCWDVQTNTKVVRPFVVRHIRETRGGDKPLTGDRDIYELVANCAQRRVRVCIENIIPRDIVDSALDQCEATLKAKVTITEDLLNSLEAHFAEFGVTRQQLGERYQRKLESITPAQVIELRKIYGSIKDGIGKVSDYFKESPEPESTDKAKKKSPKDAAKELAK